MRDGAYGLAGIAAWPMVCWGPAEAALRTVTGEWAGADETLLLWAMAASTVVLARWRRVGPATTAPGAQSTRSASTTVRSE